MHLIYDLFVYEALIYLSITLQCGCDQSLSLLLLAVTIKLLITQISSSCDQGLKYTLTLAVMTLFLSEKFTINI